MFFDTTIRQTVNVSLDAGTIRLRVSNAFGVDDLPISRVSVGLPRDQRAGCDELQPGEPVQELTFGGGQTGIVVPPGALAVSDAVSFPVKAQSNLTVSLYLAEGQQGRAVTSHPGSRTTSWMGFGDQVGAEKVSGSSVRRVDHW